MNIAPKNLVWHFLFCLTLVAVFSLSSCKKKDDATPTNSATNKSTGLSGTDDVSKIPKAINYTQSPVFGGGTLPSSADLTKYLPPIGDQGQYGTCVAWATAYNCKTTLESIKFGFTQAQLASPQYQLSPRDLFLNIEDAKKGANDCNGTDFVPALDLVLNRGVATLAVAPYTGLGDCRQANADAGWNAEAAKHKINRYRRLDFTKEAIKQELANNNPVILGAKLSDNFMTWNSDAVFQNWSSFDNVGIHSYHAMCIVGYDDAKGPNGAFKVVNSWANTWGAGGFIWIDQNFMVSASGSFCYNNNLFSASNDDQKPNPGPGPNPPQPNLTGIDLLAWATADSSADETADPRKRFLKYDIYNLGTATAPSSSLWKLAYIYYSAYDANDYGLIFLNSQVTNIAVNSASRTSDSTINWNVPIPANSSIAQAANSGEELAQAYRIPERLNGSYYFVLFADVTSELTEQNKDNNLFYTTQQYPAEISNGIVIGRRGYERDPLAYSNPIKGAQPYAQPGAHLMHTAITPKNRNTYSPAEVISMFKDRVSSGDFAAKVAQYKAECKKTYPLILRDK